MYAQYCLQCRYYRTGKIFIFQKKNLYVLKNRYNVVVGWWGGGVVEVRGSSNRSQVQIRLFRMCPRFRAGCTFRKKS